MRGKIEQLLEQIKQLEDELRHELNQQRHTIGFKIKGRKVEFEASVRAAHKKLKTGLWRWFFGVRPINIITLPIIYAMIIPLLLIDILVTFYQWTCFPVYGIKRVRRSDYIVLDRHKLGFLNFFEKLHCAYCGYGNGVVGYIREVLARTEQYFCPIKHARTVLGTHQRYRDFIDYGDAENYHQRLKEYRRQLS
ncbi:hypothetical protein MPL1_03730 [Methylophaga lonarensis MPL]|uniref:Uncharacterized protein n=1 Tax=Methylophaga lonarensis MPL TaxID=1286106 RepID=M7PIG1_9GAMM|nr:hypothetical protein [Methylophaga lonarensis]EMR13685.1 hypothetical protein MPL1_03730 [Methylophaga lonarensis MPL]